MQRAIEMGVDDLILFDAYVHIFACRRQRRSPTAIWPSLTSAGTNSSSLQPRYVRRYESTGAYSQTHLCLHLSTEFWQ